MNTCNGMKQLQEENLLELNEKRAKVLSVFSPNDMDILNGVLDSGSGAGAGAGQRDFGKHSEADSRRRHCLSCKIQPHKLV